MAGWGLLPVDDAIHAWRRQRTRHRVAIVVLVVAPLVGVAWAWSAWRAEDAEVHATAEVTGIVDDDTVAVTWRAGDRVNEAMYDYDSSENTLEVGDTVDIAYPPGHPDQLHNLQGAAIFFAATMAEIVFLGNAVSVWLLRLRPLGRQIELAAQTGGRPARVRLADASGRKLHVWLVGDARSASTSPPDGVVRLAGSPATVRGDLGLRPWPAPRERDGAREGTVDDAGRAEVRDVLVRGELRPRGTVVLQEGDRLLNTYGLVQRPVTDD